MKIFLKTGFLVLAVTLLLITGCVSSSGKKDGIEHSGKSQDVGTAENGATFQNAAKNFYKGIPAEVIGIPYEYKDICGNLTIDYLIDAEYNMISTGWSSKFINFKINKFIFDFKSDGSLVLSTVSSYGQTPTTGGNYYPAKPNDIHEWNLKIQYHTHSGGNCSLDFYNDIAIAQAKLNEMRADPSLNKVYDILLSVAQDMDYNFPAIGQRAKFVTLPNGREPLKGICDDYSNLLISRLTAANIKGVSNIQKVSGQNHAWVTLVYKGKTLYLDATWFDKNIIDENGVVDHTPYKDPRNMTFNSEIFTNHNQHHIAGGTRNIGS